MAKHLDGNAGGDGKPRRKGDCDQLMELALKHLHWDLWHWEDEAYVSFCVKGHQETHKLNSRPVKRCLRHQFRKHRGRAPSSAAVTDSIAMLEAEAFEKGWERPIHVRVARHEGCIYIDLGDKTWRIVKIDMHGWKVIEAADAPVVFLRSRGMRALPEPRSGGRFDTLLKYINIVPDDAVLIYVWIIASLWASGPYPLLVLIAEQGAGKTTSVRVLRCLTDPSTSPFQSLPKDEEALMISAKNRWLLALDNLSNIRPWLSDALCRISTGGGLNKRKLETSINRGFFGLRPASGRDRALGVRLRAPAAGLSGSA